MIGELRYSKALWLKGLVNKDANTYIGLAIWHKLFSLPALGWVALE